MVNTVEDLAEKKTKYDVILNMEVIEHVSDVSLFIKSCSDLLSENGIMIFASLNRTLISYGLAIIGVEYILGCKRFNSVSELVVLPLLNRI